MTRVPGGPGPGPPSGPHGHRPPFPSAQGAWVPRLKCQQQKSFGWFWCSECGKTWTSAHAFREFRQACQKCETFSLACCLWQNDVGAPKRQTEPEDDPELPHDKQRCEGCQLGCCLVARVTLEQALRSRPSVPPQAPAPAPATPPPNPRPSAPRVPDSWVPNEPSVAEHRSRGPAAAPAPDFRYQIPASRVGGGPSQDREACCLSPFKRFPACWSGALFAAGWWLFVDGRVHFGGGYPFAMWLPGLLGTLAFCMPSGSGWSGFEERPDPGCVFCKVLVSFASITAVIWVTVATGRLRGKEWSQATVILQTLALLISSLLICCRRDW